MPGNIEILRVHLNLYRNYGGGGGSGGSILLREFIRHSLRIYNLIQRFAMTTITGSNGGNGGNGNAPVNIYTISHRRCAIGGTFFTHNCPPLRICGRFE